MPSPVMGSVAAAASPTNRARPPRRRGSSSSGRGWARPGAGPRARQSAPRTAGCAGRREQRRATARPCRAPAIRRPGGCRSRRWPAVGQGERPGVAGQQVGLEPHPQGSRAAGVRRRGSTGGRRGTRPGSPASPAPRRLRSGDHIPSAADDVAGLHRAQPGRRRADERGRRSGRGRRHGVALVHRRAPAWRAASRSAASRSSRRATAA